MRNPDYAVVLNYECRIDLVEINPDAQMLVIAPGQSLEEIKKLRAQVEAAKAATDPVERVVAVNFDCRFDSVSYPG